MQSPTSASGSGISWTRGFSLFAIGCSLLFLVLHQSSRTVSSNTQNNLRLPTTESHLASKSNSYCKTGHPRLCPFEPPMQVNQNGGWFYNKGLISREHVAFDPGFGPALLKFIGKGRIIDIGAGVGQLGYFIGQHLGSKTHPIEWSGYDGGNNIQDFWGEHAPLKDDPNYHVPKVCWIDASVTMDVDTLGKFDWAITIEVGEHIPKSSEQVFLDNISKLSTRGVILSWAIPGQGGNQHINEQSNEYIIKEMHKRGLTYNKAQSMLFRRSVQKHDWLRKTIMVFEF